MTLRYVLKSLNRRKMRTILMLLALIVGVGALVALSATVDTYERFYLGTVSNTAGDFDLVITKSDIEPDLLIDEQIIPSLAALDPAIERVVPRIQGLADIDVVQSEPAEPADGVSQSGEFLLLPTNQTPGEVVHGSAEFIALNPDVDDLGHFEVISGTLNFSPGYAVVLQETADTFDLQPGDTFDLSYALPVPRQEGVESAADVSTRRARTTLTVSGVALQRGVTGLENNNGVLVDLIYAQVWLGLPARAERVVLAFDESIYGNNDPQASAFQARSIAEKVRNVLGDSYSYELPRATVLSDTAEAFIFFQALVSIYGILSLSVVGLLVRTMVMTNVREQTRDLALFRILGAPRRYLFSIVAVEVATLGVIGISVGALGGQALTNSVIAPLIAEQAGVPIGDIPLVSANALILSILTAAVVLAVSAYQPARRAAGTKIMYAINPG
ncbi:MAG: ABC transporter permease, partial [Anaerolineae bacterium]|nr:ABC transporter permease [Anaerolineae bacterium]